MAAPIPDEAPVTSTAPRMAESTNSEGSAVGGSRHFSPRSPLAAHRSLSYSIDRPRPSVHHVDLPPRILAERVRAVQPDLRGPQRARRDGIVREGEAAQPPATQVREEVLPDEHG